MQSAWEGPEQVWQEGWHAGRWSTVGGDKQEVREKKVKIRHKISGEKREGEAEEVWS